MSEPPRILWMNSRGPLTTMMDNVLASRMGRAAADAAKLPAGDYIDSGLALLLKLNEAGFEVRHVSEPRRGRDGLVEALAVAREALEPFAINDAVLFASAYEGGVDAMIVTMDGAETINLSDLRQAFEAIARIDALQPRPRDEQHDAGSGNAPDEPDAPV